MDKKWLELGERELTYSSNPDCTWLLWRRLTSSGQCTHSTCWGSNKLEFGSCCFFLSMKKNSLDHAGIPGILCNSLSVAVVANQKHDLFPKQLISMLCVLPMHQLKMVEELEMELFWRCLTHLCMHLWSLASRGWHWDSGDFTVLLSRSAQNYNNDARTYMYAKSSHFLPSWINYSI